MLVDLQAVIKYFVFVCKTDKWLHFYPKHQLLSEKKDSLHSDSMQFKVLNSSSNLFCLVAPTT